MVVIEGYRDMPPDLQGSFITIGNFDGVHRGHRHIFAKLVGEARNAGRPAVVVTFDPHPKMIIHPDRRPFYLITTREEKTALIAAAGLDALIFIPFTPEFAMTTAEDFVCGFLWDTLRIRKVVIGHDYTFGRNKGGNEAFLKEQAARLGFDVEVLNAFTADGDIVSSTKVRNAILTGDVAKAANYLGRPYNLSGVVVEGHKRGMGLGFPTANLAPEKVLIPAGGVYAVLTRLEGKTYHSVLNIGHNPTFGNEKRSIEVFIMDFHGDLYGKNIEVLFIARLRDERRFATAAELVEQIHRDVSIAEEILVSHRL